MRTAKFTLLFLLTLTYSLSYSQCPNLVWADEFDGTALDETKWSYQVGDGCAEGICGWGNSELQYYKEENVTVSNGTLKITAKKERVQSKAYTSGRIRSINKGDWTYGRFEARIKLPAGAGLWPAFWMLPTDEVYGEWPLSGEIDIMENIGSDMSKVFGTIHYGDLYPGNQHQGAEYILESGSFADDFHVYAIEWEEGEIRWYLDDILYSVKTTADTDPWAWPFDQNFHFLLNLAVGGNLGGDVDNGIFPQTMEVDYVRVYDGPKTTISGPRVALYQESGVVYNLENLPSGSSVSWTVPSDAVIVSGQGSSSLTVDFGANSGNVTADVSSSCGSQVYSLPVTVEPAFVYDFAFENFDAAANVTLDVGSTTGALTEVSNPGADEVNGSALCGKYVRDAGSQYDLLVYQTGMITNADEYKNKAKKFYMDVYTNAPVGTSVILQLENSAVATPSNYPGGRHSRYSGTVEQNNQWQRIIFTYMDAPDASTDPLSVDKIYILFASNTYTGDTYYFDNLDSYIADDGTGSSNVAPTASFTYNATDLAVDFTSTSSDSDGTITSYSWDFGDGNTSTSQNPSYTYAADGSYSVSLTVTDNEGATDTDVQVVSVSSGSDNVAPTASFTYNATDLDVDFTSTSSDSDGTITGYSWDFGDGNTSTSENPSHTYAADGDYSVSLTVTDNEGATDTDVQVVSVSSGGTGGDPVSIHVQSIVTGTEDAGRGAKRGAVTITVHDDLENPVSGVTVSGTFEGTFAETVSGVTGADGTVYLTTSATAKGGVTVDYCVEDLTHASLAYDPVLNDITCTNPAKSAGINTQINELSKVTMYPNPVKSVLNLTKEVQSIEIMDVTGRSIIKVLNPQKSINVSELPKGTYLVRYMNNNKIGKGIILKE